jgi:recombinational DNA repair protein RecT
MVQVTALAPEQKQVLRDTVAKDTTDSELAFFLNVAKAQELNPFAREVWCIKYGGKLTIQTARDGYLKIARRNPQFDRIQSAEVRDGDHFMLDTVTGAVEHRINIKRGTILGAWATITRKDGVQISKFVSWSEYKGSSDVWNKFGSAMITKAAESAVCKQFGNITGIIAEELMRDETIEGTATTEAEQKNIVDEIIAKINTCKTPAELAAVKDNFAGLAGKLFAEEVKKVAEVARLKIDSFGTAAPAPAPKPEPTPVDPPADEEKPKRAKSAFAAAMKQAGAEAPEAKAEADAAYAEAERAGLQS